MYTKKKCLTLVIFTHTVNTDTPPMLTVIKDLENLTIDLSIGSVYDVVKGMGTFGQNIFVCEEQKY